MASRQRGELAGVLRSGSVLGRGSEENAKEREEWISGVLVRLVRALGVGGGLCLGRATATARWRPRGGSGRRGTAREAPARGKEGGGRLRSDAWKLPGRKWRGEAALHGGRAALCTVAVSK